MKRGMRGKTRTIRWQIFLRVDTELHVSARSSQESDSEHPAKVNKIKEESYQNSLAKRRNCEVILRIQMTRACGRRIGEALLRAKKFGDLITADHKVLNEGCESRDKRCRSTRSCQLMDSNSCKTKTSHETERSFSKFVESSHKPKVVYPDN